MEHRFIMKSSRCHAMLKKSGSKPHTRRIPGSPDKPRPLNSKPRKDRNVKDESFVSWMRPSALPRAPRHLNGRSGATKGECWILSPVPSAIQRLKSCSFLRRDSSRACATHCSHTACPEKVWNKVGFIHEDLPAGKDP